MQFLSETGCAEWCERHGYLKPDKLRDLGVPPGYAQHSFEIPAGAGPRVAFCRALWHIADAGDVTERLLWIKGWGIGISSEHMPLFYSLRRALGENRPLIEMPGQLISPADTDDGLSMLIVAGIFSWDAWVYSSSGIFIELSNDEVGAVYEPAVLQRSWKDGWPSNH
jgi:hypothetical protein